MDNGGEQAKRGRHYVEQNRFVKEFSGDVALEHEKALRLFEISEAIQFFNVPKPIHSDPGRSRIVYELMVNPVLSIRESFKSYLRSADPNALARTTFEYVGRCLALMHNGLKLSTSSNWNPPTNLQADFGDERFLKLIEALSGSELVVLHGDFGFSNIYAQQKDLEKGFVVLWVVDSSPNYFMTFKTDEIGPAEVDLANLVACMHGLIPLRDQFTCDWNAASDLVAILLAAYESESARSVNIDLLRQLVDLTLIAYMKQRFSSRIMRRIALSALMSRRRQVGLWN